MLKSYVEYYAKLTSNNLYRSKYTSEKEIKETVKKVSETFSELTDPTIRYQLLTEEAYKSDNYKELLSYAVCKPITIPNIPEKYVIFYKELYRYYKNDKIFDNYGEIIETKKNKINKSDFYSVLKIKKPKINKKFPYYKKINRELAETLIMNVFYDVDDYKGNYFLVIKEY